MVHNVVAIELGADGAMVFRGFPRLKLWPEAIASLKDAPETPPRVLSHLEKRCRCAVRGFSPGQLLLRCIRVLAEGKAPAIETLRPARRAGKTKNRRL
jgi:hypothetical protein